MKGSSRRSNNDGARKGDKDGQHWNDLAQIRCIKATIVSLVQ